MTVPSSWCFLESRGYSGPIWVRSVARAILHAVNRAMVVMKRASRGCFVSKYIVSSA